MLEGLTLQQFHCYERPAIDFINFVDRADCSGGSVRTRHELRGETAVTAQSRTQMPEPVCPTNRNVFLTSIGLAPDALQ
jgi:hypothetical protein